MSDKPIDLGDLKRLAKSCLSKATLRPSDYKKEWAPVAKLSRMILKMLADQQGEGVRLPSERPFYLYEIKTIVMTDRMLTDDDGPSTFLEEAQGGRHILDWDFCINVLYGQTAAQKMMELNTDPAKFNLTLTGYDIKDQDPA